MAAPLLKLSDIELRTPEGFSLCANINAEISAGQTLLVHGANGSGKTSLLKTVLGFVKPHRGEVTWQIHESQRGYLPQLQMTHTHLPFLLSDLIVDKQKALDLGLLEPRHFSIPWNSASGGERKRALLTRLLLGEPKAILLDEPLNHLDRASRLLIIFQVKRFLSAAGTNRIAVIVSHEDSWEEGLGSDSLVKVTL